MRSPRPPQPLSTRSMVLSLLLGAGAAPFQARDLVALMDAFGVSEPTLRVALSRMLASRDLERGEGGYRLSDRLLVRQHSQDAAISTMPGEWTGTWRMAVVAGSGRPAGERAELRSGLRELRLAELREGVWMRPDNLPADWPAAVTDHVEAFIVHPRTEPAALSARLWDLEAWSVDGAELLAGFRDVEAPQERLAVAAAILRHLRVDPLLPGELLPAGWPAAALRATYAAYREGLTELAGALGLPVLGPAAGSRTGPAADNGGPDDN